MTDLLLFTVLALGAVWSKGKLDTVSTAGATLLAFGGLSYYGFPGWGFDPLQALFYAGAVFVIAGGLLVLHGKVPLPPERKAPLDYAGLLAWGMVQQAVLLGYLGQASALAALGIFVLLHAPNRRLMGLTAAGGATALGLSWLFGPSVLAAGAAHAALSWFVRDVLDWDMGVGRSYGD